MSELIVEVVTEPDVVVVVPAEPPTAVVQVNVAEPGPPGRDADATAMLAEHIADATPHPAYDNLANGRFITYLRNGMS